VPIKLRGTKPKGTKKWQMVDFEIDVSSLIDDLD
jgi:hypothetical protein